MVSSMFSLILAATLGQQAPAEAAWLKAVPADADAVVYLRGASATRDDLLAMIRAMSPTLAQQAEPAINQGFDQMVQQTSDEVAKTPFLAVMKLPEPGADGPPPIAVLGQIKDVDALIAKVTGGGKAEKQPGGFEKVSGGNPELYLYRGDGFVAVGPSPEMVREIAAKPGASLDAKLSPELKAKLFGGDIGAYVSLVAVQNQYGEQIDQARESFLAMLDQAGGQLQAGQVDQMKAMYSQLFDSVKQGDAIALNVNFDAARLQLSGLVTVKPDTDAAKALANTRTGTADSLAKLPADYLMYVYMNIDPENFQQLMQFNMANAFGGQANAEMMKQSMEVMKASGRQEVAGAVNFGGGFNMVNVASAEHPQAMLDASKAMMKSMKDSEFFEDLTIAEDAETYKDLKFTKITAKFDFEKMMANQPNNPQVEKMLKTMFGEDGTMTSWYGTDGKRVITVTGKNFDDVKPKLDMLLGSGGIGQSAGFKAVRSQLPDQVNTVFLVNAQQMVTQVTKILGTVTGGALPAPTGMPKEAAYLGGSLSSTKTGTNFDLVVPSAVGPVFEKGFGALIQGMQGQINQ